MRTTLFLAATLAATALPLSAQVPTTGGQGGPLDGCAKSWGIDIVGVNGAADALNSPATNLLGDTPGTVFTLAPGGCVSVSFGGAFTQDGTPFSDIGIDVVDLSDCYEVAVRPSNVATRDALLLSNWEEVGDGYYRPFGVIECGDQNWDIDFYAPGNAPGSLSFDAVRLCVEGTAVDDVEFARTWANQVCPCVGPVATMVSKPCGFGPLDPVFTADPFELYTCPTLRVETQFPNVPGWFYISAPAQQALNIGGCDFWLTTTGLGITSFFNTDNNGNHVEKGPLLISAWAGIDLVLQARVCAPNSQFIGPLAPFPDFFSNSLIIRIGCPAGPTGGPVNP
jgi:hypothetical protein